MFFFRNVSAGLGDSCFNPNRVCVVTYSLCDAASGYTCQCSSGYVQYGNQCVLGYGKKFKPQTSNTVLNSNTLKKVVTIYLFISL